MERFEVPWGLKEVILMVIGAFAVSQVAIIAYDYIGLDRGMDCGGEFLGISLCHILVGQGALALGLVGLTLLIIKARGAGLNSIGLGSLETRHLLLGGGAGVILMVVGFVVDYITSSIWGVSPLQEKLLEGAQDTAVLPVLLVVGSVFAPVSEEVFFRGFAYPVFRKRAGVRGGIFLSSVFFAAAHFDPYVLVSLTVVALGLAYLYERTGSIIPSITAHFVVNTASFLLAFTGIL